MLQGGKYDPSSWDEFFDTMESTLNGTLPIYFAGSYQE